MERTLIILKPDTVQRGLMGRVISRFEDRGFKIIGFKFARLSTETAEELYATHKGKPFYPPLIEYITSGPVLAVALEGHDVIEEVRAMMGKTNPREAAPGSIRGDFGQRMEFNVIHGSDSQESVERELPVFFSPDDLVKYDMEKSRWS
ncbi:MAG: nucleoside-diphosphate kinase [Chloroflexi bacterium]|nr:nucleoside-diphosphate kinase [Chloroflexota bacterium]